MITLRNLIVFFLVITGVSANAEMDFQSGCKDLIQSNQCIEAIEACTVFANQGDPEAQTLLGFLYSGTRHGDFRKNYKQSFNWISMAAEQDYTKAQLAMAEMYKAGEVVPENARKAKVWYEKAAEKGNLDGINGLARLYRYGVGVRKDYEQAFALYQQAALKNHLASQVGMGLSYRDAKGVKKNLVKAYAWLSLASDTMEDRTFKDIQKRYEQEREDQDKTIPHCKFVLKYDEFSNLFALGYAKRELFSLKQRMSLKQIKKGKDLAAQLRQEIDR